MNTLELTTVEAVYETQPLGLWVYRIYDRGPGKVLLKRSPAFTHGTPWNHDLVTEIFENNGWMPLICSFTPELTSLEIAVDLINATVEVEL